MTRHRIPVRVGTPSVSTRSVYPEAPEAAERARRGSADPRSGPATRDPRGSKPTLVGDPRSDLAPEVSAPSPDVSKESEGSQDTWRERALRLQAEMDNYRKRQRRLAREEAQADQDRLLRDVLRVADNLDRTLAAGQQDAPAARQRPGEPGPGRLSPSGLGPSPLGGGDGLRQGVALTRDDLLRILAQHGVERFEALGEPFDPAWHEAVHVVSARALGVEPGTVVDQVQAGYRKHARLFRPAQVVVAN